jgi:alcohol dehydrogenase class IV
MSTSAVHSGARRLIPSATENVVQGGFAPRISFGPCRTRLAVELRHLHAHRVLFLCSERHLATVQQLAQQAVTEHGAEVATINGSDLGSDAICTAARTHRSDVVVAVGGGGIISRAKRLCTSLDLPLIALPTTYSAAELDRRVPGTPPDGGLVLDTAVAPAAVIYDPCLTLTLSPRQTGSSLLGAVGAGVEVLCSTESGSSPWILALHGLRELGRAALDAVYCPGSRPARSVAQFGAYLVGAAVVDAQTSAAAFAGHELSSVTGMTHAEARVAMTLWLVDTVADTRPDVRAALLAGWPGTDPFTFLHDLAAGSGAAPEPPLHTARHIAAITQKYGI